MSSLDLNKLADTLYRRLSTATVKVAPQRTPDNDDGGWYKQFPFTKSPVLNGD